MPNIIFCKFCTFWWLRATLIPFSAWPDTLSREELSQSRTWRVMGTLPKLLRVPELCLQSFCSLMVSLIWEDLKTNGLEARRWPGLTSAVPSVLWDLCGCFCDAHYTETPPQASKKAAKKDDFFTWCGKCARESPQVLELEFPTCFASPIACLLYLFLPVLTSPYKQVFSLGDSH